MIFQNTNNTIRILFAENDPSHIELIKDAFSPFPSLFHLFFTNSMQETISRLNEEYYDLLISECILPDGKGIDFLKSNLNPKQIPLILITSHGNEKEAAESLNSGAIDFVLKTQESISYLPNISLRGIRESDNIRKRRIAEEALQESEESYRRLIETANEGMWILDNDSKTVFINKKMADMLGYTVEEMHNTPITAFMNNNLRILWHDFSRRRKSGIREQHDFRFMKKDGTDLWAIVSTSPIFDRFNNFIGSLEMITDITNRKQMEEEIVLSHERYKSLYENAQIGLYRVSIDKGIILDCNRRLSEIFGYSDVETFKKEFIADEHYLISNERNRIIDSLMAKGENIFFETRMTKKDKSIIWVKYSEKIFPDRGYIEGVMSDITEQKKAEEALNLLAIAVEQAAEVIMITDVSGNIQYINPVFESITNYTREEALGKNTRILKSGKHDEAFYKKLWATLLNGEIYTGTFINKKKTGELFEIEMTISPIRDRNGDISNFVAVFRDITQQKVLESKIRQGQKLEAIGTLAGGIAHDFNNILYSILGFTEIALDKTPDGTKTYECLQEILKGSKRASDLVNRILTFSRQTEQEKKPIEIQSILKETLRLLKGTIPATIQIQQDIRNSSSPILADPTQIHQVIMNLCTNAYHSMRNSGGVLTVKLSDTQITDEQASQNPKLLPGDYVLLSVSDSGSGIEKEIIERIFEPYFTTKKPGEGTGLGLATVHGIVQSYNGFIVVESKPGQGSIFDVYLPAYKEKKEITNDGEDENLLGGNESILFIDDEESIVEMVKSSLKGLGYKVDAYVDSIEAIKSFRSNPSNYDIIISDQTMPNLTGNELAKLIHEIDNHIPVILCSGFSENQNDSEILSFNNVEYMKKPIERYELDKTIRNMLEKKQLGN